MDKSDIGRKAVVIVSGNDTIKGIITNVFAENRFEITDDYGNVSEFNKDLIIGLKWKGDA